MPSLYTRFRNILGGAVDYAELSIGSDPNDNTPRRVPQSAPSDAGGAPLYAAGDKPALDGTDATGVSPPTGGAGLRGWLSGIYAKLPALSGGKIPVDIGSATVTLSGPVTISNEVEVKNDTGSPVPTSRPPLTYTAAFAGALTASWQKVTTTTAATKGLRIAPIAAATAYDIEWVAVPAGSAAPTDVYGEQTGGGEDFAAGLPIGDIYLRSASLQVAVVKTGA